MVGVGVGERGGVGEESWWYAFECTCTHKTSWTGVEGSLEGEEVVCGGLILLLRFMVEDPPSGNSGREWNLWVGADRSRYND
jgi:hypothetical protein